jgi:hypothetical protein
MATSAPQDLTRRTSDSPSYEFNSDFDITLEELGSTGDICEPLPPPGITNAQTSFVNQSQDIDLDLALSDYGSDFNSDDEREIAAILSQIEGPGSTVESQPPNSLEDNVFERLALLPKKPFSSQNSGITTGSTVFHSALENLSQPSPRSTTGNPQGTVSYFDCEFFFGTASLVAYLTDSRN